MLQEPGQSFFEYWRSHFDGTPDMWKTLSPKSKAAWAALEARERKLVEAHTKQITFYRRALDVAYTELDRGEDREDVKDILRDALEKGPRG
jgi:hypothetical protein